MGCEVRGLAGKRLPENRATRGRGNAVEFDSGTRLGDEELGEHDVLDALPRSASAPRSTPSRFEVYKNLTLIVALLTLRPSRIVV